MRLPYNTSDENVRVITCFPRGRQVQTTCQNCKKIVKNVRIVEFHDHIWNHNEKRIQISTNMPGIGLLLIREIAVNISEM